jgi:hypothetical protein
MDPRKRVDGQPEMIKKIDTGVMLSRSMGSSYLQNPICSIRTTRRDKWN